MNDLSIEHHNRVDGAFYDHLTSPFAESAHMRSLLAMFLCIDHVRIDFGLDVEEALLYLGVGYLNTERIQRMGRIGYIAAINMSSVTDFVHLSKEIARRKIKRMIGLGLIDAQSGLVVRDIEKWFSFVHALPVGEPKGS